MYDGNFIIRTVLSNAFTAKRGGGANEGEMRSV